MEARWGHEQTPVATVHEMIEIIWQLPGTADFRKQCADLVVRYLGGDQSLIAEIQFNRHAQEDLAFTQPDHPARLCGEAVERRTNGQMIASDPDAYKNSRLQTLASAWTLAQAIGSSSKERLRAQAQYAIDEILLPVGDTRDQYVNTEIILRERGLSEGQIIRLCGELGKDLKYMSQKENLNRQSGEQDFGLIEKHQVGLYHRKKDARLIEDVLALFKERPLYQRVVGTEQISPARRDIIETRGYGRYKPTRSVPY